MSIGGIAEGAQLAEGRARRPWATPLIREASSLRPAWPEDGDEYRIGPEDVLEIVAWDNAVLSRTVPVRPDGCISVPLLNDVPAAGLTPMALRDCLVSGLREYVPDVEISVLVREVHSFKVSVLGGVRHPGRYELRSRATALDIVAQAGGFEDLAAPGRLLVLRAEGTGVTRIPFTLRRWLGAAPGAPPPDLRPGDTVVVP